MGVWRWFFDGEFVVGLWQIMVCWWLFFGPEKYATDRGFIFE
jgi:hypothetical protein